MGETYLFLSCHPSGSEGMCRDEVVKFVVGQYGLDDIFCPSTVCGMHGDYSKGPLESF